MMVMTFTAAIPRRRASSLFTAYKYSIRTVNTFHTFNSTVKVADTTTRHKKSSVGPITSVYQSQVESGQICDDQDQRKLAARLDRLYFELQRTDAQVPPARDLYVLTNNPRTSTLMERLQYHFYRLVRWLSIPSATPKGVYIYGSVGVGKSMLMDTFFRAATSTTSTTTSTTSTSTTSITQNRQCQRVHFHEFMLHVHERIHAFKQEHPRGDALPAVAVQLAQQARVLCFDEFQVTDIADAMILKRLFDMLLLELGVVVVATSNRAPLDLYLGGINRSLFLPFITNTLYQHFDVMEMNGRHDYRRDKEVVVDNEEDDQNKPTNTIHSTPTSCFFWPSSDQMVRQNLQRIFDDSSTPTLGEILPVGTQNGDAAEIPVRMGRTLRVPRATDTMAWFHFDELCGRPLGSADYIAICERYSVVIVDHVPQLDSQTFNEARRFVALIDALYESRTKLILASVVPLKDLFLPFEVTVETQDDDEEIKNDNDEIYVKGEGGSSSSAATTMIRTSNGTDVEWSATGRIGVSLAQLSAAQDVSFSFRRAESRLAEMNRSSWGRWQKP